MRTLAVRHPWAALIADGGKTVEIRSWNTSHRGPVLIVASGKPGLLEALDGEIVRLPTQVQVCIVDLVDVRPMTPDDVENACTDFEPGAYAWLLSHISDVYPAPHKGRLSLYTTPDEQIERLPENESWLDHVSPPSPREPHRRSQTARAPARPGGA